MSENSVRGVGKTRAGATDTTMLIWKVIAANPGITRQGIWERVEHDIPAGFALRRFPEKVERRITRSTRSPLHVARRRLLNETLISLERRGLIAAPDRGMDRPFRAVREPRYRGNPDAIDHTGTKAAEHMAVANALRIAEKAIAKPHKKDGAIRTRELYDAVTVMVKALRAKGSSD